jgi:PHD/YefM family antitoxin component YafN of YafNO toxin-antitoxin module
MLIKPISYMKAHAATLSSELGFEPMFVTQNGNESLVVQTAESYQATQEKMAFLELIIKSDRDIKRGDVADLDDFLASI